MENWQTVQRGRQQHRQQSKYQNDQQIANTCMVDNGWPVRPAQTTLDGYLNHTATNEQQATHRNCRPTQQNTPWGDRDLNEQGPGPRPEELLQNREHTPLKYVWNSKSRYTTKATTDTVADIMDTFPGHIWHPRSPASENFVTPSHTFRSFTKA
jgi:hypothetical protein